MWRRIVFCEQIIISASKLVINIQSIHDARSEKHQVIHTIHLVYMVQPIAPRLQTCTACYCTEYCRQLQHNGKYYIMGAPTYMRSVVGRNGMRCIPVKLYATETCFIADIGFYVITCSRHYLPNEYATSVGQGRIQAQADQAAAQGGRFEGAASKLSKLLITTTPFHSLTERYSMNVGGNFN